MDRQEFIESAAAPYMKAGRLDQDYFYDVLFPRDGETGKRLREDPQIEQLWEQINKITTSAEREVSDHIKKAVSSPTFGLAENIATVQYIKERRQAEQEQLTPLQARRDELTIAILRGRYNEILPTVTGDLPKLAETIRLMSAIHAAHINKSRRSWLTRYRGMITDLLCTKDQVISMVSKHDYDFIPQHIKQIEDKIDESTRPLILDALTQTKSIMEGLSYSTTRKNFIDGTTAPFTGAGIYLDAIKEKAPALHEKTLRAIDKILKHATKYTTPLYTESLEFFKDEPVKEKPALPIIVPHRPTKAAAPIDKITSLAFGGRLNSAEPLNVDMRKRGTDKPILTAVNITLDPKAENEIKMLFPDGSDTPSPADNELYNAFATLADSGNFYVTRKMVYQAMTGKIDIHMSKERAARIDKQITKLMGTVIAINADKEFQAFHLGGKFRYKGPLLAAERITAEIGGKEVDCIHLFREPVLLTYARYRKQIANYDLKMLDVDLDNTDDNIVLKGYIARRVSSNGLSHTILLSTVYEKIGGMDGSDKAKQKKQARIRAGISKIMDTYKANKYIKGWKWNRRGRAFYSITFDK